MYIHIDIYTQRKICKYIYRQVYSGNIHRHIYSHDPYTHTHTHGYRFLTTYAYIDTNYIIKVNNKDVKIDWEAVPLSSLPI